MQIAVLGVLLAAILSFFFHPVQERLRAALHGRPPLLWLAAAALCGAFYAVAAAVGQWSPGLAGVVAIYVFAPSAVAYAMGAGWVKKSIAWGDFAIILLLWLPLEFSAGAPFVSKHAQGFLHSVAYGVAILLALVLFVGFRSVTGLKFQLPSKARDWWLPLAAFVLCAPVLIVLGVQLGFMPPFHVSPKFTMGRYLAAYGVVLAGTGLPEEILFRSLIQNLMFQRFGENERVLVAASAIFGAAHLDNGPQAVPNWRYMIEATIAGVAYGRVFQKASSVTSSAMIHMMVDWTKHFFF
jgi:membrane protease YdiL (CAAX protease family)